MKKKIGFSVLFLCSLYFILLSLQYSYSKSIYTICEKPLWAQKFRNKNFDFIVAGSSRAENNVDINTIEAYSKLTGLNIAYSGSAFSENYLSLFTFFKNGNKVKYVLMNADAWGIIDQKKAYSYPFHGYYYFALLGNDTIDQLIRENHGNLKFFLWKYVPFIKYAEFNNIYNPVRLSLEETCFEKSKGTDLLMSSSNYTITDFSKSFIPNEYSIDNLKRIIKICSLYKTQLILFESPSLKELVLKNKGTEEKACHDIIKTLANQNSLQYWDYSLLDSISDNSTYFYNANHLNAEGAKVFSKILAENLLKASLKK